MRLYNGCPDDELKAYWERQANISKELGKVGLRATYFPMEEKWMVFDKNSLPVTDFYETKQQAADAALALIAK